MRERVWGSPNSDEGTYTVVLCIYKYFVVCNMKTKQNLILRHIHNYVFGFIVDKKPANRTSN